MLDAALGAFAIARVLCVAQSNGLSCFTRQASASGTHITRTGSAMAAYEILIADDHPLFRSALQQALTLGLGPQVRLVEAASIAELEACLSGKADWDLVLLDLNMPGAYGFSGLVLLRGQYPQVPVVMVSAQEDQTIVARSR